MKIQRIEGTREYVGAYAMRYTYCTPYHALTPSGEFLCGKRYRELQNQIRRTAKGEPTCSSCLKRIERLQWDWSQSNAVLARQHNRSREYIRQIRNLLFKTKGGK